MGQREIAQIYSFLLLDKIDLWVGELFKTFPMHFLPTRDLSCLFSFSWGFVWSWEIGFSSSYTPSLSLTLSPPLVFTAFIAVQRVSSLEIRWQCKNQGEEFKSKLKLIFMPRFQGDRFWNMNTGARSVNYKAHDPSPTYLDLFEIWQICPHRSFQVLF